MYFTFAGLDQSQLSGGTGPAAKLLRTVLQGPKYGSAPPSSYVLYGVQALQVIPGRDLEVGGTRASVTRRCSPRRHRHPGHGLDPRQGIKIDPGDGDVNTIDISVLQMKNHVESSSSRSGFPDLSPLNPVGASFYAACHTGLISPGSGAPEEHHVTSTARRPGAATRHYGPERQRLSVSGTILLGGWRSG